MEELKWFQGSAFDTLSRKKLIEDRDASLELTAKIQELQNAVNCMDESRDFKNAESVRSGQSNVTCQPAFFSPCQNPEGMLSRSLGMPSRKKWAAKYLGHMVCWETFFANPVASSTASYPQESNLWVSNVSEHTPPHVMSESRTPVQDQRCQSGPSARNSFVPSEGDSSKNYEADQQRLQISDLHFDKFTTPATFACWKITFKTEVCTCTQVPAEAMLWIEEVELVDSVDDLQSSCSVRGIRMPDFGVLDGRLLQHWIESSILPASRESSVWRNKKPKKEDRFLRGRHIAYLIYEYFRVTEPMVLSRIVPTCLQLFFEMIVFRNSIRNGTEFYHQWRKSHLMTSWKDCTN